MKILYGIAGEGYGHAIRSKEIIRQLNENHEVLAICGGKAYPIIKQITKTEKIEFLRLNINKDRLANITTGLYNTILYPYREIYNLKALKKIRQFKPDLIITDFESYSAWYAFLTMTPCIAIDNYHLITKTSIKNSMSFIDKLWSKFMKFVIPRADLYVILSHVKYHTQSKKTMIVPPIVREELTEQKISYKDYILVYQTKRNRKLIDILKHTDQKYTIYGYSTNLKTKNLTFKTFSEKEFIKDLAECKAVISNAGNSLISESVSINKPMLLFPIKDHHEQKLNAILLKKIGGGTFSYKVNKQTIENFLDKIKDYKSNLVKYNQENMEKFDINKILEEF